MRKETFLASFNVLSQFQLRTEENYENLRPAPPLRRDINALPTRLTGDFAVV
jgi:hypothetical protein